MTPTPNTDQASPGRAIGASSVAVKVSFLPIGEVLRMATAWQIFAPLCQMLLGSGRSVTRRQPPRAVIGAVVIDPVVTGAVVIDPVVTGAVVIDAERPDGGAGPGW